VASSTAKKVVVRRFERDRVIGFVNPFSYLQTETVEVLRTDGTLALIPYGEVKTVAFVKDFEGEREAGKIFLNRPKLEGLWVRMLFLDGEVTDGILPNNLLSWDTVGYTITPPEPDGNCQKLFVPRIALRNVQILGVVGSPLRPRKAKPGADVQPSLFS
jgi:hypothetical protein